MSSRIHAVRLTRVAAAICALIAMPLFAQDIGQIKTAQGSITVERGDQKIAAQPGFRLRQSDVVHTGANSTVGIIFADNTIMSAGPNSTLDLERFEFNSTTHDGRFIAKVHKGTLSVISGKMAKQSPQAMTVRTPATVLGVRGTEFFVKVDPTL